MTDAGKCLRIVVGFNTDASLYFHMLVDKVELNGGLLLRGGYIPVALARVNTHYARNLNELSTRSIRVLHYHDRQHKNDDMVLVTPSSFRTSVLWAELLCSHHRLKVMVSCEAADAASESDLRSVITSEDVIQLLRKAYANGHNEKIALILDYLRLMPMPPKDIPFLTSNVNALSGEIVRPSNMESAVLTRFHYPQFRPDFGFGVDPGRLRGYPLAHLAGTWR